MGQLGELIYEHGKRCLEELLSCGAHSHENIGSKVLLWHGLAQSLYYVPPQPDGSLSCSSRETQAKDRSASSA